MASIPFDFDKLAAIAPPRLSKPAGGTSFDEGVPFLNHFQAASPAPKTAPPANSTTESARNFDSNRISKPEPATPENSADDAPPSHEVSAGQPAKKHDEEEDQDDSPNTDTAVATAVVQAATPPVDEKPDTAEETVLEVAGNATEEETLNGGTNSETKTIKIPVNNSIVETPTAVNAEKKDLSKTPETQETTQKLAAEGKAFAGTIAPNATDEEAVPEATDSKNNLVTCVESPDLAVATCPVGSNPEVPVVDADSVVATDQPTKKEEGAVTKKGRDGKSDKPQRNGPSRPVDAVSEQSVQQVTAQSNDESLSQRDSSSSLPGEGAKTRTKKEDATNPPDQVVPAKTSAPLDPTPSTTAAATAGNDVPRETASPQVSPHAAVTSNPTPSSHVDLSGSAALRLPAYLAGSGTARGAASSQLTEVDQTRFLQRVAKAFQAAQDRDGEIRLRLSPPELGALRLEIKVQDGVMTARMEAESPAAKSLLLENLPALRDRLAEQGIRVDQFDIDLMNRQPGGNGAENMPGGDDRQPLPSPAARFEKERNAQQTSEQPTPSRTARVVDGRLNVIV